MPSFAAKITVQAAQERGQAARDAHFGGSVKIGARVFACEVFIGGRKLEQHADGSGFAVVQRLVVKLRKSLLSAAPARDTVLTLLLPGTPLHEVEFTVADVTGQSPSDIVHVIEAQRLPPSS